MEWLTDKRTGTQTGLLFIIGLVVHADTHSFEPLLYRQRAFGTVTHMRG